ncbi:MAG TPA: 30S ribosomal protein S20 [Thermoanaerobacterales bacterium]|nr:30S ribosomal protein S20 [Thermoanaerobacterales bacterium]
MANIASAKKRVRQARKRTLQNNKVKSQIRYSVKKFLEAINSADSDNIQASFKEAIKIIDKAASKGVIHKNAAARKKSSLYKRLSELNTAS